MTAPKYTLIFSEAAREFFADRRVDRRIKRIIRKKIDLLATNPYLGKPLVGPLAGCRRLAVSFFRVIYRVVEDELIVEVIQIGLRRDIYGT